MVQKVKSSEKVAYWLDLADYDIETAETLFNGGRWLYVAFMCHQAIEKTLKAYWCGVQESDPPFTHNHMRLAEGCGLYESMNDEQRDFLDSITNYNIEARYPEDKEALSRMLTQDVSRKIIDETKQLQQWIISCL
ncbi:MAG: HEPN domain-containing protein [Bacteroidaceae bacterium]|nr:HEPN domain-containing protein [Bacteroidaceae bacterium]